MAKLSDSQRAYLIEMRALTTDRGGNDVLVGLTPEETDFYLAYGDGRINGEHRSREDGKKYLFLHEKHERERLAVLGAERQARVEHPTKH
jgi:hypothetical protein